VTSTCNLQRPAISWARMHVVVRVGMAHTRTRCAYGADQDRRALAAACMRAHGRRVFATSSIGRPRPLGRWIGPAAGRPVRLLQDCKLVTPSYVRRARGRRLLVLSMISRWNPLNLERRLGWRSSGGDGGGRRTTERPPRSSEARMWELGGGGGALCGAIAAFSSWDRARAASPYS
jgi:hypothetical protein